MCGACVQIMVYVVGVLGQHLLWSAAAFKPKTGDPTAIAHERDEFIQQLTRLLRPDVAAPDVQDKVLLAFSLSLSPGAD